jgi:long-chain fatty acid transport protein
MKSKIQKTCTAILFTLTSTSASAAGFAIYEQSVTGLGRAFAGSAAVADDASTLFFNPAGLTYLKHAELDLGLNYIAPKSEFNNQGSALPNFGGAGGFSGQAITGGDGGDGGINAWLPNFYYAHPVNDQWAVGLGISAPFGLVTDYDETWVGRYFAVKSELKTININPSIAFQATEKLSIGFGVSAQYADVELTQMVDLGALGGFPQAADGKAKLEADDWGFGYNLGLLYQVTETTRLGVHYRSKISHTLKGEGTLSDASNTLLSEENIQGEIDLPETISVAIFHQINPKWSVSADVTQTRWERFESLDIESDGPYLSSTKAEDWENSMRYALGLEYMHSDTWQFRTGIAYDETPIPNAERRTVRIPGNDRKWFTVGASYQYTDAIVIDSAYAHLFIKDPDINETNSSGYNLSGEYEGSVDIFSVQLRWLMD